VRPSGRTRSSAPASRWGNGTIVGSHALIERDTTVGEDCVIHHGAVLGSDPQDLKYDGEPSRLEVGARTTVREYCTLNRGTGEGGLTTLVGSDCLLMAYVHVAHDCGSAITRSSPTARTSGDTSESAPMRRSAA
jgi:UDP-N-acetylglucosamine acyltransferase